MARVTISVPDTVSAAAEQRARAEKRSVSAYVSLLIEKDLRAAGLLEDDDAGVSEILAKLSAVLMRAPRNSVVMVLEEISAVLRKHERNAARRARSAA